MDDDNNNPTVVSSRPGVARRQRLLGIPVDLLVVAAVCLLVGAIVGRSLARKRLIRELLSGKVTSVGSVKGILSDDQRQMLHDLIDSGAEVLQQKIGNTVLLLVKAGGDSFSRLFVVPSLDGDRTLADLDRETQRTENGAAIEVT